MTRLSYAEKMQIKYLQERKDFLIAQFIGACEEINEQIKSVKRGEWKKAQEVTANEKDKE